MIATAIRPPGALARHVRRVVAFSSDAPFPPTTEPADLVVPLIVTLDGVWDVALGAGPTRVASFAAGLVCGPAVVSSSDARACLQVDLTPVGAARLLPGPLAEIAGAAVPLDLLDRRLFRALSDAATRPDAAAQAVRALGGRLADAPAPDPLAQAAVERIARTGGAESVAALARSLATSRQTLSRRVRGAFGLGPKQIMRIARFQAAQARIGGAGIDGWADLAAIAGYADQAHLVREFAALGGRSPGAWPRQIFKTEGPAGPYAHAVHP